jgi:hypothetical protein
MRWPWLREGNGRRRSVVDPKAAPLPTAWDPSWNETFIPAAPKMVTQHASAPPSVRLGFRDGTEVGLDDTSPESRELHEIANTLTRRATG